MLQIIRSEDQKSLRRLYRARELEAAATEKIARRIVEETRRHGDAALIRFTHKFDGVDLRQTGFVVTPEERREAHSQVGRDFIRAARQAACNIRATARRQLPRGWMGTTTAGVRVGQLIRPLDRVACYVPGGRFALPSTLLMSVIPAQVAGVREIMITSPRPSPAVLVVADMLGVKKVFRLGGAQAIAAFAYGTHLVPRADKIVGPGNRFVASAKRLVAGDCGIDFIAGPSELIVVGSQGLPTWIAADLVAQAEHDADALALFVTSSLKLALQVQKSVESILKNLRLPVAETSLKNWGAIIVTRKLEEAVDWANCRAPEHLMLLDDAAQLLHRVRSAGAIFLGSYSAVAAGDYASGGNHILPTAGVARVRGGLSTADFIKSISVQRLNRGGLSHLRRSVVSLAEAEGLKAHAHSVNTRFEDDTSA